MLRVWGVGVGFRVPFRELLGLLGGSWDLYWGCVYSFGCLQLLDIFPKTTLGNTKYQSGCTYDLCSPPMNLQAGLWELPGPLNVVLNLGT